VTSTILLPANATSFPRIPALQLLFQVRNWVAPLATTAIRVWQMDDILAKESHVQAQLAQADLAYGLSGPDEALLNARAAGRASAVRMALIGGAASTLLLRFGVVCAISPRRGLGRE